MSRERAKQQDPEVIKPSFETVREDIQSHSVYEDDIWNFNETSLAIGLYATSEFITIVERTKRPRVTIWGNRERITISNAWI